MEYYQISLVVAFVLAMLEFTTTTFIFLGFAFGALVVALLQFVTGDLSVGRDVIVFSLSSLASIVAARRYFKKPTDQTLLDKDDINLY